MQLDEVTIEYVKTTFPPTAIFEIHRSFELYELFGEKYAEDKFINLLSTPDLDSAERQDTFTTLLIGTSVEIVEKHGITLVDSIQLTQVNEVLSGLYLIQNLEDYSLVQYRLSSNEDPTKIVADILAYVTHFDSQDYLRLIESVSDGFLASLRKYVEDQTSDEAYSPDLVHKETITAYFKFLGGAETFGASLLREGFTLDNTLSQLVAMGGMSLPADLDKLVITNNIQAALEIVTFLILAKDTYQVPIVGFNKNSGTFLSKIEDLTKISPIVVKIINDFNSYYFSLKSAQQHHKNNNPTPVNTQPPVKQSVAKSEGE